MVPRPRDAFGRGLARHRDLRAAQVRSPIDPEPLGVGVAVGVRALGGGRIGQRAGGRGEGEVLLEQLADQGLPLGLFLATADDVSRFQSRRLRLSGVRGVRPACAGGLVPSFRFGAGMPMEVADDG